MGSQGFGVKWLPPPRDRADLHQRPLGDQFGDADGGPGGVGRLDHLVLDPDERLEMAAQVDVISGDLDDVVEVEAG